MDDLIVAALPVWLSSGGSDHKLLRLRDEKAFLGVFVRNSTRSMGRVHRVLMKRRARKTAGTVSFKTRRLLATAR